jgi:hypothetical protein
MYTTLTKKQKKKLPKTLKRAIENYNKSLKTMMKGGVMPSYMMGGNISQYHSGGGFNNMAPFASNLTTGMNSMPSPMTASMLNPGERIGWPKNQMGGHITTLADYFGYRQPNVSSYQMGGQAPQGQPQQMDSQMRMDQLEAKATGMPSGIPANQGQPQGQQQGGISPEQIQALAQAILQGDKQALEQVKQMPPAVQQQVAQAAQAMQAQAQGGQGQPQPQMQMGGMAQPPMAPPSPQEGMQQPPQQGQQQGMPSQQELIQLAQAIAGGDQQAMEALQQLPPQMQQMVMQIVDQIKEKGQPTMMYGGNIGGKKKKTFKKKKGGRVSGKAKDKMIINKIMNRKIGGYTMPKDFYK